MYFVDREILEGRLVYFEIQLEEFSKQKEWNSTIEKLALERISHLLIEIMIDVGNQMIDGFIMRDPGSYDDVIDILVDEKVISDNEGKSLKLVISWKKLLLQDYLHINHQGLSDTLIHESESLLSFPGKVRKYLKNELGPVSAFLPSKE